MCVFIHNIDKPQEDTIIFLRLKFHYIFVRCAFFAIFIISVAANSVSLAVLNTEKDALTAPFGPVSSRL